MSPCIQSDLERVGSHGRFAVADYRGVAPPHAIPSDDAGAEKILVKNLSVESKAGFNCSRIGRFIAHSSARNRTVDGMPRGIIGRGMDAIAVAGGAVAAA